MTSQCRSWTRIGSAIIALAIPFFLFLWAFQLVRQLGYWIEHGHSALVLDGRAVEGRLRVFSGIPRELPDREEETGFDPSKDCFLILDLGLHKSISRDDYAASFTVESHRPGHLRKERDP